MNPSNRRSRTLSNGVEIPVLGIGTSHNNGGISVDALMHALALGCRHVDTAQRYGTEAIVGQAFGQSEVEREEMFVTTKLWPDNYGTDACFIATKKSLSRLKIDYVDLYLLHWPGAKSSRELVETWRAMELILEKGDAKSIGVSNFQERHLDRLIENEASVTPHVNQIEFHPYQQDIGLIEYCTERNICVEGYSPLAKGRVIEDPVIQKVAAAKRVTPAQLVIRWSIQRGVVTIPKSTNLKRVEENLDVWDFELNEQEMMALNKLNNNLRVTWDPSVVA